MPFSTLVQTAEMSGKRKTSVMMELEKASVCFGSQGQALAALSNNLQFW